VPTNWYEHPEAQTFPAELIKLLVPLSDDPLRLDQDQLAGKLADIVIWNSDPIADITVLQRPSEISTITKDGRIVDREAGGFQLTDELPRARASISG